MTVLLVLATFVVFLAIEFFLHGKEMPAAAMEPIEPVAPPRPEVVGGFVLRDQLRYHPGHTWAASEGPNQVRVGVDDLAARLLGKAEKISLPQRGQWVRQGQKIVSVTRNGATVELVSPMEGIVTDVNDAVLRDPSLLLQDPYGSGWLITVNAPEANVNFRNLLGGMLARKWMEDAALRLRSRMMTAAPVLAQDGGTIVGDLAEQLPQKEWKELASEFFLS